MEIAELSKYGISQTLIKRLNELGYQTLTTVQQRAIESGLFERKNTLVIAPTNTGKTFVGELAALVASTRREATHTFFLVPLKALAEEKFHDFNNKYAKWGLKVAISTRDRTEFDDDLLTYQLIIATYEKMNSLLIRNPELIDHVGVVVVDELQNIAEPSRGVTLEILLTTLVTSPRRPQVIGLSATVSNAKQVADWLAAVLVETDKRDIELREGVLYTGAGTLQFDGHSLNKGDFVYKEFNSGLIGTETSLPYYTTEGLGKASVDEQVLIFVQTQAGAERLAERLARDLPSASNITDVIEQLDSAVESTPSTRRLKETLQNGVAFHHAGLLPDERLIVEDVFDRGLARVICATTTLGAGVNTPARTVVFLSHQTYESQNIRTRDYKNMAGRAGRIRDPNSFGRSILFAEDEREMQMLWTQYVTAKTEPLESQIGKSERLALSILGLVCSGVCPDLNGLLTFMKSTFFSQIYRQQSSEEELRKAFDDSLILRVKNLERDGFLTIEKDRISVTEFGRRCAEELLSPSTAKLFYDTLKKFESKFEEETDYGKLIEPLIHLGCSSRDAIVNSALLYWPRYEPERKELGDYWEFNKSLFLYEPVDKVILIRALKTTRMLMRWIDGVPYGDLTSYANHGIIKRNAETVSWIVRGLSRIAQNPLFNFRYEFVRFLRVLADRLFHGVPDGSLPVMRMKIPQINRHRAMALAEAGFNSLDKIIEARPEELMKAKGITENLALEIKKNVEQHIDDKDIAAYHRQRRLAQTLGKNAVIIDRLYKEKGDNFSRAFNDILKNYFGLKSAFVGDAGEHEVDVIIETVKGKIAVEGKRYDNRNVSAREAEEVIGKGARHDPIAHVTIGYPDFADEAKKNCPKAKVTLISAAVLGEILIGFWQNKISQSDIVEILKSARYLEDPYQESRELTLIAG